ncbi:unnamed protein product [Orchesella dallaii]|uniref:Uncharacterized protein n=1 Tax=Orchesella dallaii TaxID=48710 RepID=A0ABP1PZR8_9HEXA
MSTADDSDQRNARLDDNNSQHDSHEDGFNNMMKHLDEDGGQDDVPLEDDPEILKALEDVEQCDDFGPSIVSHVAEAFTKTATRLLSKETAENIKKGIKIPENCKVFRVPKVNPEIWQNLRTRARISDIKLQQVQYSLSASLTTIALMSDEIAKSSRQMPKDIVTKLLKMGMDGANLIGSQMQDLSYRRRQELKPFVNPEYSGMCGAKIPVGEFLFGDNLVETMKSTKTATTVLRQVTTSKQRYRPYPSPQRQFPLNFQRPSTPMRARWNGQQRSNNSYQFSRQAPTSFAPQRFPQMDRNNFRSRHQ